MIKEIGINEKTNPKEQDAALSHKLFFVKFKRLISKISLFFYILS